MNDLLEYGAAWLPTMIAVVLLLAAGPLLRLALAILPVRAKTRTHALRLLPVGSTLAWSAALIWAGTQLIENGSTPVLIPIAVVAGVLLLAGWFALRDIIAGAILRAEDAYNVGEWLRIDGVDGRIVKLGIRCVELETEDGKRLRMPYTRVAKGTVSRAQAHNTLIAHSFEISVTWSCSVGAAKTRLERAAMLSMWASPTQLPRVELRHHDAESTTFEMTVYALHPDYDAEIERFVRKSAELESR